VSHANARLAPRGRLALARCVVDEGWPPGRAAGSRCRRRPRPSGPDGIAGSAHRAGRVSACRHQKLGRIPDGGGHRAHGRLAGMRIRAAQRPGYASTTPSMTPPGGLQRDPRRRTQRDRSRVLATRQRLLHQLRHHRDPGLDRQRCLLPIVRLRGHSGRDHPSSGRALTRRKPTEKSNASTAPCSRNGPTPRRTAATPTASAISPPGCTPPITTAATPRSAANHRQAASTTCQVSTPSNRQLVAGNAAAA
jgi:hypothetical protein